MGLSHLAANDVELFLANGSSFFTRLEKVVFFTGDVFTPKHQWQNTTKTGQTLQSFWRSKWLLERLPSPSTWSYLQCLVLWGKFNGRVDSNGFKNELKESIYWFWRSFKWIVLFFMKIAKIDTSARLNSHHGAAVTSRVAGATKNSSHITTLKSHHGHHFLKEFIAGANESSKSYLHIFSVQIKKSLRARSSYAIFERNVCIIHSRLHWGAGFDRLVIYASIMAIYLGALVLTGGKLRINHSRLHWGAGFDRLIVYASIIAVYIGAVALKGRKLRMNYSRLHWGTGFDRLVVYASTIVVYIGALALKGGKLRINHSHLHWGAGLGRLVAYASIIAIYVSALTDYVPRAPNKATETRLILVNLQGSSSPAVIVFLHFVNVFICFYWLSHCFPAFCQCFCWLSHCLPASFQCLYWCPQGERGFFQNKRLKHLRVRGAKPCGRAEKINILIKDPYYLD